jgi:hypothetical protein
MPSQRSSRQQRKRVPPPPRASSSRFGVRAALGIGVTVVALLAIAGLTFAVTEGHGRSSAANLPLAPLSSLGAVRAPGPTGTVGPEGVPLPKARPLAPAGLPPVGGVDGIECQPHDQVLFHIHAHLTGSTPTRTTGSSTSNRPSSAPTRSDSSSTYGSSHSRRHESDPPLARALTCHSRYGFRRGTSCARSIVRRFA